MSRHPQAAHLLTFSVKEAKEVYCRAGVYFTDCRLTWCRYVLWLLGDEDSPDDSSAPFVEQLCQVTYEQGDVAAIDWTQSSDGLMVADACGHVSMYGTLAGGIGFSAPCA